MINVAMHQNAYIRHEERKAEKNREKKIERSLRTKRERAKKKEIDHCLRCDYDLELCVCRGQRPLTDKIYRLLPKIAMKFT